MYSRVYATIDLDAVENNMEKMHELLSEGTDMMAVVKTDGYGHGAVEIANEIQHLEYLRGYAVATVEEAVALRKSGITKPILILGVTFEEHFDTMIENDISPSISTIEDAMVLQEHCRQLGRTINVHIAIDTGMSRIGFQVSDEDIANILKIGKLANLNIQGIFTHFAKADEKDKTSAKAQVTKFNYIVNELKNAGLDIPTVHCSNSAGITDLPDANMDMVRAGITLYGMWPSDEVNKEILPLKPVLSLYSHISHIKELEAGREISYGGTYTTTRKQRIATIPVGYGDGYARGLSNKGYVLINGHRVKIVGRVCMDQFMVDVTEYPDIQRFDKVTLIGHDGGDEITMEEVGEISGRFNYEFACCLGRRIPRVFIKDGKVVSSRE